MSRSAAHRIRHMLHRPVRTPSKPRLLPTTGFEVIENSRLVEEENWEWYKPEEFYPVRIGEVFKSRYQVVGKLGYGAYSTAWLCRDLLGHKHVTMKIGTSEALKGEMKALRQFKKIKFTDHVGSLFVRQMVDEFKHDSKHGRFQCVVHPPLALSIKAFRRLMPDGALPVEFVKGVLKHVLLALDFLHTEVMMIHTDIQEDNILMGLDKKTAKRDLRKFELEEFTSPSPRKIDGSRVIYESRPLVPRIYKYGRPVFCDFGQARFGNYDNLFDIQPYQYRAPEVIFDIPWDEKVDIWSVGVMIWDMLGNGNLFRTTGGLDDKRDNVYHLAHMIALLGPPPLDFLQRTKGERVWKWFDENGKWKGAAEVPNETLEGMQNRLEGEEKALCLRFMRRMLRWKPEERSSAKDLLDDPWLKRV